MNRLEAKVLAQIRARGDGVADARVLVACSGGGDSTALLTILWALRKSLGLELMVAHADHGLREASRDDAAFVRDLCRRLDLDLVEADLDVPQHAQRTGQGVETAARELRWTWLKTEADSSEAAAIATGHHLDDHTETVLVRLARGGGTGSVTPLPARQGRRWSPLIQIRREELHAYLRSRGLPWREDETNASDFTARNRWRKLLEPIRLEAPAIDAHLWETHLQVRELQSFRDALIHSWRGSRWDVLLESSCLSLRGSWTEAELRWTLETAFKELGWPREADLLRDLAAWCLPHLLRRSRKPKTWGGWKLETEPSGWQLHPISRETLPTQVRLDQGETLQEET